MSNNNHKFVIRLDDERTLLFKGKKEVLKKYQTLEKEKYHIKHYLVKMKNMN